MAISRGLSSLDLYDVLANIIPGILLLFAVFLLFPIEKYAVPVNSAFGTGVIIALSLVVGHIIQYLASKWVENPTLFGDIMTTVQSDEKDEANESDGTTQDNTADRELEVPITYIENETWSLMQNRFNLPDDFNDYRALFRLLLSYIESTPASRALRFQALQSLFRSLWATGWILLGLAIIAIPMYFFSTNLIRGFPHLFLILSTSLIFIHVFKKRVTKFNQLFVQYAIADFYAFETQD